MDVFLNVSETNHLYLVGHREGGSLPDHCLNKSPVYLVGHREGGSLPDHCLNKSPVYLVGHSEGQTTV